MKMHPVSDHVNLEETMTVCVDVSQKKLTFVCNIRRFGTPLESSGEIDNRIVSIRRALTEWEKTATEHGCTALLVACEPSGGYEDKLMKAARRCGANTCYVSSDATAKAKVITRNDTGKSDPKDCRVISDVLALGRTLVHRMLDEDYEHLRELGKLYEKEALAAAKCKVALHDIRRHVFPDWSLGARRVYEGIGRALFECFRFNARRVALVSLREFRRRMLAVNPRLKDKTLKIVWRDAQCASLHITNDAVAGLHEERFAQLYDDHQRHLERKQHYREQMLKVYSGLAEAEQLADVPVPEFAKARIVAQTGPLADFDTHRKLLRYAGLNIRERTSGKYTGHNRISKRGRPLLRKVLYQAVWQSLIGEGRPYGEYYRCHRDKGKSHHQVMVSIMRKALKMIWGVNRSAEPFSLERLFKSANAAA